MKPISTAWRLGAAACLVLTIAALAGCASMWPQKPNAAALSERPFTPTDAFAQNHAMARGVAVPVNVPKSNEAHQAPFVPARHFKLIHDAGFSTVRLVLGTFDNMDASLKLDPQYLARLDTFVKAALDQDLTVILDEHDYNICGIDPVICKAKLNAFWSQVAPRYKDMPNKLVFEMLNEPHQALTAEMWNAQLVETLAIIRASNPTRNVIIGPDNWNGIEALPQLALPATDNHIIATFHYYHPMEFTHQGAAWVPQFNKLGVTWGSEADVALLNKELDFVKSWADANKRPIFMGEFGAYENAAMADRVKWTSAVSRGAEARGFSWAYWQFTGDFIVYDTNKEAWVEPILHALIPQERRMANSE